MIEKRYGSLNETTPHEQYLLILSEGSKCFGSDFADLTCEINDRVRGSELTVCMYRHPLSDVRDSTSRLIQNSVWLIHWEECLENEDYPSLDVILDRSMFPEYAEAIICTEKGGRQEAKQIENQYKGASAVHSKDSLYSAAQTRFADINPLHTRGKKKIKNWNNEVWDRGHG